jgi:choice-of-anchor A domain-containing protein
MKPMICGSKTWMFLGMVLGLCLGTFSESRATLTVPSGLDEYSVVAGSSLTINDSTISKGDVGIVGGSFSGNNDNISGDFGYGSSVSLNQTVHASGTAQDLGLSSEFTLAKNFSSQIVTLANSASALDIAGNYNGITLTGNGGVNVINFNDYSGNLNGTIKLTGNANDIFYINVDAHFNITGVDLEGVSASNVFWNINNGQSNNLNNGYFAGTFLSTNSQISFSGGTLNGNVYGSNVGLYNMNVSGIQYETAGADASAMAPEVNSKVALSLFAAFLLGSSWLRSWKNRRQELKSASA